MSERPKKWQGPLEWLAGRSRRFWIALALLPVLYVASFGPACWISSRVNYGSGINFTVLPTVYRPLLQAMLSHRRIAIAVEGYARLGAAPGWHWLLIISDGDWAWAKLYYHRKPIPF
jgi:hypothetical protein